MTGDPSYGEHAPEGIAEQAPPDPSEGTGLALAWPDRLTWGVIALVVLSLGLHLWNLGARAYHHDESQHAAFSYYFAQGGAYAHNPLLHGPLQFHVIALIYRVLGDSDFTARLFHALMGSVLVATPLLLRKRLGDLGVLIASALLILSPSMLYYARFARNDVPVAVFTVMMFAGAWRYRSDQRLRWLVLVAAGLALSFASKETTYISAAVLLLFLNAAVAHDLFAARHPHERRLRDRLLEGAWLLPSAWLLAALWGPLSGVRARLGLHRRPPVADVLVVVGTLVVPELPALVRVPLHRIGGDLAAGDLAAIALVAALLLAVAGVGALWRWDWWLACATVFFAITVPLYMSLGTNPAGIGGLFWNSLSYWLDQQEVRRGTQPWFYYLMLLPLYEHLVVLPALVGGAWLLVLRRGEPFVAMLLGWFGGTLLALSVAGEKMPWLTVHLALPLILLAAYVLGIAVPAAARAVRAGSGSLPAWGGAGFAIAALSIAFALTIRSDLALNVWNPDTPVEPMIYTQSTPEIPPLAAQIEQWLAEGRATSVQIDDTGGTGISWPWAWYLRRPGLRYMTQDEVIAGDYDPRAIVIRVRGPGPAPDVLVRRPGTFAVYRHRWWFPEEGYRGMTWQALSAGLRDGSLIESWARLAWSGAPVEQIGALQGEVWFPGE